MADREVLDGLPGNVASVLSAFLAAARSYQHKRASKVQRSKPNPLFA
jgi:hypothetical protein